MQTSLSRFRVQFPQFGLAILLGLVLLLEEIVAILSSLLHIQQSPYLFPLLSVSISAILTLWVHYDSRSRNMSMGIDQAMYIFFAWPITFPYYAYRSRGLRSGSLLLLSFVGIFIFTLIAAIVISIGLSIGMAIFSARQ
jgi:hypothetical protein